MTDSVHAPQLGEWQPIDTAPKDGQSVLLGRHGKDVQIGHFYDTCEEIYTHVEGNLYRKETWTYWVGWETHLGGSAAPPTHWMPLPGAPADA